MNPDWESEEDTEGRDQRAANAERDALRRAQMVGRARERKAYWQRELALERFDEFKGEMRRRIQVEQTLLDGLEHSQTPSLILLRNYQRDAVHMASEPKTERDEEREDLETRISKAAKRKRDLNETLRLTPERQGIKRDELLRKIGLEDDYIADLKAKQRLLTK
ncbi:MAG: hypothetical protein WC565_10395 [Parcubacteria group bacterium]|jgi:hypothetical protein